jgi:hypothetical protein
LFCQFIDFLVHPNQFAWPCHLFVS